MGTKRKPMKKSSCKPMLPVLQRKTNSQGPTASPRNFFFLVFLLSRRCRHQPTAMNGRAQKVSMGRQRSTYQRRAYDGEAAKGAVDGHRRGWGYIVKFLHPMYFFPSLVQPPYHNTRPSTESALIFFFFFFLAVAAGTSLRPWTDGHRRYQRRGKGGKGLYC